MAFVDTHRSYVDSLDPQASQPLPARRFGHPIENPKR